MISKLVRKLDKKGKLQWDQLAGFGVLGLFVWIIVQESPAAKTAAGSIITSAQSAITNLLTGLGTF